MDNTNNVQRPDSSQGPEVKTSKKPIIYAFLGIIVVAIASIFIMQKLSSKPALAPTVEKQQAVQKKEVNALTFYTWWTSASEKAALNKFIEIFSKQYPDVAIIAAPVTGGAGFKMVPVIKSLIEGGEAPDAFQMHAGYEAKPYFDAGLLSPIDYIWESEKLGDFIPRVIQDMNKFDGHYYSVPVDLHRGNLVWYNKSLLDAQGINPDSLTTWEALFAAADKLKAKGVQYPIQMGESWTAAHVFETIIASEGIDVYEDWINGKITDKADPRLLQATATLERYLSYVNKDHNDLSWDEAIKRIIKKEGAFSVMGDWANGEFKLVGMKYGKDYGSIPVPGTKGMYGLIIDTFQHPKGISHPTNSDRWLKMVASREGQDAFNPAKGSISVRTDSDVDFYDSYQQAAINDFKNAKYLYPSVVHGSGAPETYKLKLIDVIGAFTVDLNAAKAVSDLADYTRKNISEYNRSWSIK